MAVPFPFLEGEGLGNTFPEGEFQNILGKERTDLYGALLPAGD